MDADEDDLGASSSFGLNRVLASSGIDPAAFSNFFSKSGRSSSAFADVDANSDEDRYEDDISDAESPIENVEDVRAREREQAAAKAEEERWYRRAMEMQRDIGKAKVQEKVTGEMDRVREVWPEFEIGRRLRMTEVFYETPKQRRGWEASRRKRRKLGTQTCELRPEFLHIAYEHLRSAQSRPRPLCCPQQSFLATFPRTASGTVASSASV
jgi:hypothetical protein